MSDWLYPSRPVDRSLNARIARALSERSAQLRRRIPPLLRIARELGAAAGTPTLVAGAKLIAAWRREGIDPRQFAEYMLWDVPAARHRDFVSARELDPFLNATVAAADRALMRDKAGFAEHCRKCGIPCLPTAVVVNRREGPQPEGAAVVEDKIALAATLERLTADGDVFLKPAVGKQGHGVYRVGSGTRALDADGREIAFDDLAERVFAYRHPVGAYGYLVQPLLESHPRMIELTGVDALATLRVITAVRGGAVETIRAFLRIPAPGRLTNNFHGGVTGTLLAALDPASGRLGDLVGILRAQHRFVVERTDTHPGSGRRITGRELPDWREALDIACRGALLHPRTATLGWDISLGPSGWRVLEVNTSWGPGGPQTSSRAGLRPDLARLFPGHWT